MHRSTLSITMLGLAVISVASVTRSASADVFPFSSGVNSNPSTNCFEWSTTPGAVGLIRRTPNGACNNHYYMPLYWRDFSGGASQQRTVTIRGRRVTAASELSCTVYVYDADGNFLTSDGAFFPTYGTQYTTITLTVDNITSGGTSFIACSMTAGNTYLLNASWTP